ncbi:hypothetical protein [Escherichia coli]|uniref:hypothetical protein n=1 Tax=Escherichia coli TaxID=562 RepID=UPI0039815548
MPICWIKSNRYCCQPYAQKTGKTTDEIAAMLADETWMSVPNVWHTEFADQGDTRC